ncbi:disco-interacting protein 2 isoform X7 [Sabethes cyaneus]|uniref:disco-interacting protein 2 isoform X7 n=1 Tax=Sabethes cyaneus TaxID=53552 RepID=UPI00237EC46B|nr:disco-interacting protein 2 isoform X7 [Sabethes cyaneus]
MKPITFESIRNLLKTKKKQKDKSSIDQSFKRSDSFKRISIRKSYLERGRKRNAASVLRSSTKNLVNINEFENQAKVVKQPDKLVKTANNNEASSSTGPKESFRPVHELSFEEKLESNDASLDEKIRALQEINDRYISENQNLIEKSYEATKTVEKVKIKKPPRPSKLGFQKSRENDTQTTIPTDLKARSSESNNTLTSGDTLESTRAKNISHVSITTSDVIPEEDESTVYSFEPETQSMTRKTDDLDDKSFYSISTFTIESNTMNNTNASSKKSFRSNFSTSTATKELPTLVTIKTYCEPNASIQSTTHVNEKYLETSFDSYPEDTLTKKTEILSKKAASLNKPTSAHNKASSDSKTSSLKDSRPKINTQTFKMIRSKSREGIVIRIPAIDGDQIPGVTPTINHDHQESENLNRQLSNDSALDLIDVDIKVDEKDMQTNNTVELKNQKNKYKKKLRKSGGKTATLDLEDCRNNTFKSHEHFELERGGTSRERPEPKFIFPSNYFEEENNIFYDQTVYDDTEIPSPENSIPYALRIKENPFTKNKEFYSINTGRIWKQLNLGQEEDLSILSATPRIPVPKTKNESFKSMSSRDSGFSLTLTKPKNLFRRKSKKATLLQRRKPKLAVSRDGYFKRVMVVQRNSSKKKRSIRKTRMQSKDIFRELYDENWTKLDDDFTDQQAPDFARDFENFCNNRRYHQRIDDLEAFYEEHLKRLRHYYIQKKKLNEAAIKEFYRDYNGETVDNENDYYDSFIVTKNDTIRIRNQMQKKYLQEREAETSMEYMFPHPDKRKANGLAAKQKAKGKKHLFHEVRAYGSASEPLSSMELGTKGTDVVRELKLLRSAAYAASNFHLLPSGKVDRAANTSQNRNEGQVHEISLANVFPSVDGKIKSSHDENRARTEELDEGDEEFSENEFLINSIGENLYCVRCDKVNSDCDCYDDTTETTNDNSNDNDEEDEFREQHGEGDDNVPDDDDDDDDDENYCDVHEFNDINIVHVNHKKKVKRKKSKKRVRKNHSTLRRGSYWGDITQKGYEKKRTRLLQPYSTKNAQQDSSTDDESIPEEGILGGRISTPDRDNYNLPRDHILGREPMKLPSTRDHHHLGQQKQSSQPAPIERRPPQSIPTPNTQHATLSDTSSAGSPPAVHRTYYNQKNSYDITDISEYQPRPYAAPDITQFSANTRRGADRVTRYVNLSNQEPGDTSTAGRWKVSAKIQQLLNTLKRPKRRPLPEFYEDNDIELEIAANPKDPNAPKPEGSVMTAVQGEQLIVPSGLPRTLEAALQRYGTSSFKAPMATVLDPNGKMTTTLTYGKLLSRAQKIAYALSTKVFSKGPEQISLKPGDRVALVYPNSDPLSFLTAWYGCMFRGLVPLPIELPLSSSDSPPQQVGFLLSSCGVQVALTSEACLKGLPKSSTGEVAKLKGWPRLHWFVTEHLPKVPKDFNTNNNRICEDSIAYIEYTTDKEGSVMGVTVTRQSMINHCRALTMACHYTEGETIVCVLDFKREVGLWHSILTSVLNGMHVLFIPYALMKLKPSSWMQLITKYRASCCLVKSRDLHWGLLATKDHKEISLSSLRMLLVADGANPWSLSSCDQFLSVFQSKGLRPDAICPCASSSEVFTVSLRRPGRSAGGYNQSASGRGVLSMAALSHGVVRVDSEDSLTSLTLQDCGQVMPSATMVVVNAEGPPVLCKTDQVGEICVTSGSTGTSYFGLDGMTNSTFKVQPLTEPSPVKEGEIQTPGKPISDESYVRSGLLGFLGPGGLVFVCGSRDGLMTVTGRKHNADDIIATVLAVEPVRFIYRGRIAVFSIKVLRDERVCVIAEQRPDCSEEESFQWMSRVLQAVDSIHQVGIYCLALVPPNHLPKTPLGGIHLTEARRRFLEGSLHPANVLMCPHTCVTNLPKPRELHHDASVGPASVMVGNLVQGNRLASAQGRDIGLADDNERKHQLITGVLRWRANSSPDHVLYTLLNSKGAVAKTLTCSELHKRAEKIAALLQERGKVNPGDHVALIFPPGLDLICAFYGCLYLGAVPVTIRPPHPQNLITTLPTVRMIVDVSKSGIILSIQSIIKLLKSREAATSIDPKSWPVILDIEDNPKRKLAAIANSTLDSTAYLDFSVSTCGRLSGVIITHRSLSSLCASLKLACELYPSRHVALCLDPYCGLGFSMWTLISVYSGHHSILIAPYEVEANPSLWLSTLSQYRVRDTFCSYGVIELCTKALSNSIQMLKQRNVNLGCVRTCVVVAEERPRVQLTQQFCKLFQALGLNTRCVSTSFGCRVNPAICVQGASSAESAQVYVDLRALRNNRVALVERGAPNSLCLVESGKLLPGVRVIIANPDSKGQCGDSHLGEIWVQSPHNSNGYFTIYGDETDYNDHFNAKLVTGCSISESWARTGYLGFLRRTECSQAGSILDETTPSIASRDSDNESIHSQGHNTLNSTTSSNAGNTTIGASGNEQELHDAVYIVGALDEVITLRGMYYHPIDIENSVLRCHKKIAECAVFTWTNLLVVVVELDGNESEALDLVPLVTNTVLEEHQLIVGVVVVVDPGVVPINSRGEKQRMHLRDGFLADQLDPIYVAYNM